MIKSWGPRGTALVTFTLDAAVGARDVSICGDWNSWSPDRDVMEPAEGGFARTVELEAGRTYRFRYLLDGQRWENDWAADSYLPNDHGSTDSVVDLTTLGGAAEAAPAKKAGPAKRAGLAKKAAPAKKTAGVKKAAGVKKGASAKKAAAKKAAAKKAEPVKREEPEAGSAD